MKRTAPNYGPRGLPHSERQLRNQKAKEGLLWCSDCQQFLSSDKFWKSSQARNNYGHRHYCIECENTRRNKKKASRYHKKKNTGLKQQWVDLAGGCCQRCGYDESQAALSFHHIYREEKEFNPAKLIFSNNPETTWAELDKCCLLCMNCHLRYTAKEWRAEFIKRDGLGWEIGRDLPLDDTRYEIEPENLESTPIPKKLINPYQMTLF